jgi:hypothetical protein
VSVWFWADPHIGHDAVAEKRELGSDNEGRGTRTIALVLDLPATARIISTLTLCQ